MEAGFGPRQATRKHGVDSFIKGHSGLPAAVDVLTKPTRETSTTRKPLFLGVGKNHQSNFP